MVNLEANPFVSIVVWRESVDRGYQLTGRVEKIEDSGVLNGYAAELEPQPPIPQVEKRLVVKVEKMTVFTLRPHSDVEI